LHLDADFLLELCHVHLQSINLFIPLSELLITLSPLIINSFLVDSLLEPLMAHSAPAAKKEAHLPTIHKVFGVGLDTFFELLHLEVVDYLVEVDSFDEHIVLPSQESVDLVLEDVIPLLFIVYRLLFLVDLVLHISNVIVFVQ